MHSSNDGCDLVVINRPYDSNGSDLVLGFDSTVGVGFDLASSTMADPSANYDSGFNPYP